MAETEKQRSDQRCPVCGTENPQRAFVPWYNALVRGGARLIGFFGFAGAVYGLIVALSGFDGHYGAYPKDQLIVRSLLVGLAIIAVSVGLGLLSWYLLEEKSVTHCDWCGHLHPKGGERREG